MSDSVPTSKAFSYFKDFWFIAVFIGTLIVGWTNINSAIKYQDARITALETQSRTFSETLTKMATDISYIRGKLESK